MHTDLWVQGSAAEKYAEETGIAFQLTNILRDVKEDAERGRLYLPLDLLARHGVQPERWVELSKGGALRRRSGTACLSWRRGRRGTTLRRASCCR